MPIEPLVVQSNHDYLIIKKKYSIINNKEMNIRRKIKACMSDCELLTFFKIISIIDRDSKHHETSLFFISSQ